MFFFLIFKIINGTNARKIKISTKGRWAGLTDNNYFVWHCYCLDHSEREIEKCVHDHRALE